MTGQASLTSKRPDPFRPSDETAQDDFAVVRSLLEAMPLPTDQYGLACTRLQNAQRYLRYTEPVRPVRTATPGQQSETRGAGRPRAAATAAPQGLTGSLVCLVWHPAGGTICEAPCHGCRITAMAEQPDQSSASSQSVTLWLGQLQAGESAAAQQLWQRYLDRLLRLASRKLGDLPRRVADEEDVVLSAFHDFLRGSKRDASRDSKIETISGKYWSC